MELILTSIGAHAKTCIGCRNHKRDVMLSFQHEGDEKRGAVHDLFLTQEQATGLLEALSLAITRNEKTNED